MLDLLCIRYLLLNKVLLEVMNNENYNKQRDFFIKKGQEGNEEAQYELNKIVLDGIIQEKTEKLKSIPLLPRNMTEEQKQYLQKDPLSLFLWRYGHSEKNTEILKDIVLKNISQQGLDINEVNLKKVVRNINRAIIEKSVVQQPQPKKEKLFKNAPQRPQSASQIYRKDKEIPQEPSVRKSNQSKNNFNNSFTSTALTLSSSVLSTSSSQSDLNSIQEQNSQKEVQTQSKLEQIKSWFAEKFSNISSFLSNPFSFGQKSEVSTSNITITAVKQQTSQNQNLSKQNNVLQNQSKSNYR